MREFGTELLSFLPGTASLVGAEPCVVDAEAGALWPPVDHVDAVVVVALGQRDRGEVPLVLAGHQLPVGTVEQLRMNVQWCPRWLVCYIS